MPPTKLTSTKRFAVRLSLVTGSTVATIIGAQSLAALDQRPASTPDTAFPVINQDVPQTVKALPSVDIPAVKTPDQPAAHAAPLITIVRHPGQASSTVSAQVQASSSGPVAIKPPDPVRIAPPDPIIVQAPAVVVQAPAPAAPAPAAPAPRPATRSSR